MALKITCPHCSRRHELKQPYPLPGSELHCWCGRALAISYPPGLMDRLRSRGVRFAGDPLPVDTSEDETVMEFDARKAMDAMESLPEPEEEEDSEADAVPRESYSKPAPTAPLSDRPPQDADPGPAPLSKDDEGTEDYPRLWDEKKSDENPTPVSGPMQLPDWDPGDAPAPPLELEPLSGSTGGLDGPDPSAPPAEAPGDEEVLPSAGPEAEAGESTADMGAAAPKHRTKGPLRLPSGARLRTWIKRAVLAGTATAVLGVGGVAGAFWWYSRDLPTLETLATYRPPTVTLVEDKDGKLLGEIYEKRRYVVPLEKIPKHVQNAFIASEDAAFWEHAGIDYMGIARAMFRNVQEMAMAQGASTITQQVARNFLLTSEKKLARKIREAILARRVESAFEKEHILYLYLNEIYLGSGAYGVEAAARVYFDKHVEDLTLAEGALLAGLPQRPSDYSPHRNWEKARARQEYVIGQMIRKEFVTGDEGKTGLAEEIRIVKTRNPMRILAPYFTEHVRRHLVNTYGSERVYNEGLIARTTCDLELQQVAQAAVTTGVEEGDQNLGWRGAEVHLESAEAIKAHLDKAETELREADRMRDPVMRCDWASIGGEADGKSRDEKGWDCTYGAPLRDTSILDEDKRYEAVVLTVDKKHVVVGIGSHKAMIPLSWTPWGFEPNVERSWRYRKLDDFNKALQVGDVVEVLLVATDSQEVKELKGYAPTESGGPFAAARLRQAPLLQGALLSVDLSTGATRSMVGGVDIETSEFNRAVQAQRQVGSTFKPIVYATAIASRKLTAGSILLDAPVIYNTLEERLWKPGNYGEEYLGNVSLRKALALSINSCTVRVLDQIGLDDVYDLALAMGITSHMEKDLSMGLGSSSLTMLELLRAYTVFPTQGQVVEPFFIESVSDRDGNVLEEHEMAPRREVLEPPVAGIMTWLLREVARSGTAARTNRLGIHVAGKTGTTNNFKDAWFMGFTPDVITTTWVGYDKPRSMGVSSTGGRVSLPIWMEYMRAAYPKSLDRPFPIIPDVRWIPIDESTGRITTGGRSMPFLEETVPTGPAMELGQKSTEDLLNTDF
jgi:penicillin-binding protein 1A